MPCVCLGDPARLVHRLAWLLGLVSWSLVSGWLLPEAVTIAAALGAVIHLYRVLKSALALLALALCVCCCVYAVLCMCMCVGRLCSPAIYFYLVAFFFRRWRSLRCPSWMPTP